MSAVGSNDSQGYSAGNSALTNAAGDYSLNGVPIGGAKIRFSRSMYAVEYYAAEYYNDKPSFGSGDLLATESGVTIPDINAQLTTGGSISGNVTNGQGTGLQVNVRLYSVLDDTFVRAGLASSAGSGDFIFYNVMPGDYKIFFNAAGTAYASEWYIDAASFAQATVIPVTEGNATTGINALLAMPEINLKQGAADIATGGTYGFGSSIVGTDTDRVFTVENLGTDALTLSGLPLTISGTNANQFAITVQPTSPVAAAGSTAFTVRFHPTSAGEMTAQISIASNDGDENPYVLNLTGTGIVPATITVISPNGGETWAAGSTPDITWTQTGLIGTVTIDLYKGGVYRKTLGSPDVTAGTFSWAISLAETPGTDYRVLVWQGSISDQSDTDFTIVSAPAARKVDFNKDGQEDILWRYYGSGGIQGWTVAWLMNQSGTLSPATLEATPTGLNPSNLLSGSTSGASYPMVAGKARGARPEKVYLTPQIGKRSTSIPRDSRRHASDRENGRWMDRAIENLPGLKTATMPSAASTGSMEITALGSSETVFLPTVQDTLWELAGTGDFDRNGTTDTLWRYYGAGALQGLNIIWYMNGTAIDHYGYLPTVQDTDWRIEGTGDFNGDGTLEILWRYYGTGGFQGWDIIWYLTGETISSYAYPAAVTDLNWKVAAIGDFNGDKKADLLWRYSGTGDFQGLNVIWYMNGAEILDYGYPPQVTDLNWKVDGAGDFDADTKADLLWRYYGTDALQGWTVIWYMNDAAIKAQETLTTVQDINWRIVNR